MRVALSIYLNYGQDKKVSSATATSSYTHGTFLVFVLRVNTQTDQNSDLSLVLSTAISYALYERFSLHLGYRHHPASHRIHTSPPLKKTTRAASELQKSIQGQES